MAEDRSERHSTHWHSDFNMGMYYFERFNDMQRDLDKLGYYVGQYNQESMKYLKPYLAALRVLFNNVQPALSLPVLNEMNELFDVAELAITESFEKTKKDRVYIKAHKKLIRLHGYLLRVMQSLGIGLLLSRNKTTKRKLKELLRGEITG